VFFTTLHHLLGVCCALYAIQLLLKLRLDFKGNRLLPSLTGFIGGLISILLAVLFVLGIDYIYPIGDATTKATFFIRVSFLIPLSYLAAALSSLFMSTLLGRIAPATIVQHMTYLGITLIILAPAIHTWYLLARQVVDQCLTRLS